MSFDLGVWHSETPLSDIEAGELYVKLCKQEWIPTERNAAVDAFYDELIQRYPKSTRFQRTKLMSALGIVFWTSPGFMSSLGWLGRE